jgi:hypothetical protein
MLYFLESRWRDLPTFWSRVTNQARVLKMPGIAHAAQGMPTGQIGRASFAPGPKDPRGQKKMKKVKKKLALNLARLKMGLNLEDL